MTPRILAIEDDPGISGVLRRGLGVAGFQITFADDLASGREAWAAGAFDLVLLDVMLPDGDGISLLGERRASGDRTPVVLLTAREEADLRDRALAAGATAHLAKPFAFADLVACVRRYTAT